MSSAHFGKYANNMKSLFIHELVVLSPNERLEFEKSIPNVDNFPNKNRCLIMIDTLSITALDETNIEVSTRNHFAEKFPELFSLPLIGVSIDGLGVQNTYDTINKQNSLVGICPLTTDKVMSNNSSVSMNFNYQNVGNILSCGVLGSSPFGKSLKFRLFDYGKKQFANDPMSLQNTSRAVEVRVSATTDLQANPAGLRTFTYLAPEGKPSDELNDAIQIGMLIIGHQADGTPYFADEVLAHRVIDGVPTIFMEHLRSVVQGNKITFFQPIEDKAYVVNINLKMLFLDEEDMKEV